MADAQATELQSSWARFISLPAHGLSLVTVNVTVVKRVDVQMKRTDKKVSPLLTQRMKTFVTNWADEFDVKSIEHLVKKKW